MKELEYGLDIEELKEFCEAISASTCEGGSEGFLG